MTLTVVIKHNGKVNKAGKLSVIDEQGKTLLSKIPVAIPLKLSKSSLEYSCMAKVMSFNLNRDLLKETFKDIEKDKTQYKNAFNDFTENGINNSFIVANTIVIACDQVLVNDETAFIIKDKDFKTLVSILSQSGKSFKVEVKHSSFMFFLEDVSDYQVKNVQDFYFKMQKEEVNLSNKVKVLKEKEQQKQKIITKVSQKNVVSQRNNFDTDPLNDLLAFYNPELALMFRPHSTLAWFLYFNDLGDNINQRIIDDNIHNISGFENVASSEVRHNPEGYTVKLFDDVDKTNEIGVLKFDTATNSCELRTQTGEKNIIVPDELGKLNVSFVSENGSSTSLEMVQDGDNFIGNWHTNQVGSALGAGFTLDSSFDFCSNVGKANDLSGYLYVPDKEVEQENFVAPVEVEKEVINHQASVVEDNNVFNQTVSPSHEPVYESLVQTSATDNSSWASADPYSN